MKKLISLLLVFVMLFMYTESLATGTYAVGTKTERLPNPAVTAQIVERALGVRVNRKAEAGKSIYSVGWIDPPQEVHATSIDDRVYLSWIDEDTTNDMHAIYEKIGSTWYYIDVSTSINYNFYASDGTHTYGVSSVWYSTSSGDFYESDYLTVVTVSVLDGSDTPGTGADVRELSLTGTIDKTMYLDVYDNTYLHIKTDALTWVMSSNGALIAPDPDILAYTSLGKNLYLRASKHKGAVVVATYAYTTRVNSEGRTVYEQGSRRAFFNLYLTYHSGNAPAPKTNISKATIKTIKPQIYTGKEIKPYVSVIYKGKALTRNKDFTVKYSSNKAIGVGKVTITGKGAYTGTKTATFIINPKAVRLTGLLIGKKQLTVKWAKGTAITGYQIECSLNSNFKSVKRLTIANPKTVRKVVTKLNAGKKYYVRVRTYKKVNGKSYYSAWSNVMSRKTK